MHDREDRTPPGPEAERFKRQTERGQDEDPQAREPHRRAFLAAKLRKRRSRASCAEIGKGAETSPSSHQVPVDHEDTHAPAAAGLPLSDTLRAALEPRFGMSFAAVRVHPESPRAGGTVHALTEGEDVHVAPGRYQPETEEGRRLLTHELAHVMQQRGAHAARSLGEDVAKGGVALEADAEQAAEAAIRGGAARVHLAAPPGVKQRFDSFEHLAVIDRGVRQATGKEGHIRLKASGLVVTAGEVGALTKDYFSEFDRMDHCPRERLQPLLDLLRWQLERARDQGGRLTPEQAAFGEKHSQELTAYRETMAYDPGTKTIRPRGALEGGETKSYFTLARKNDDHFFGLNLRGGLEQIWRALNLQLQASTLRGAERSELERQAMGHLYASFHTLTDALSTGHLLDATVMRGAGRIFWAQHNEKVADHLAKALLQQYRWLSGLLATISPLPGHTVLGWVLTRKLKNDMESLLLKLEHDRFNQQGLWVFNRRGQSWLAFGDSMLALAPGSQIMTQAIVAQVTERFEDLKAALVTGQAPPIERVMTEIEQDLEELLPSHVEWGGQHVPVEQFAKDERRFLRHIEEQVMQDFPEKNGLCRLLASNSELLGEQLEEWLIKAITHAAADREQFDHQYPELRDLGTK